MKSALKSGKLRYIFILSAITAAFSFICIFYMLSVSVVLEEDNKQYFDEIAFETANTVESKLASLLSSVGGYTYRFAGLERLSPEEQMKILSETVTANVFHDIAFIDLEGNAVSPLFGNVNLSRRDYFMHAMQGRNYVSGAITSEFNRDDRLNVFAVPVKTGDKITGVLAGAVQNSLISEMISSDVFGGKATCYVMDSDGLIVLKPSRDVLNIEAGITLIEAITPSSGETLLLNTHGSFSFEYDGESYYASYKTIDISKWMVITIVRSSDIFAVTHNVFGMVVIFTSILMVLVMAAILFVGIRNWISRKKYIKTSAERDNLKYTDLLTGGPSFEKFLSDVKETFEKASDICAYAMISMDINKFRTVNDHLGYEEGSKILIKLSELIRSSLTEGESYTRKSADSFCILIKYVSDVDIFGRIDTLINDVYYQIEEFKLIMSFGICKIDDLTMDPRSLIDRADLARRTIKDNNDSSYAFFDDNMLTKIREEKRIENIMEFALESNEFKVYLQPKYDLHNPSVIIGAEALIRWFRGGKMIPPGGFIPIFERNGFITKIDKFVFEEVCKQQKLWLNRGYEMRTISVNMSRMNIQEPHFVRDLYDICTKYNVPTKFFEIEITESVAFENLETLTRVFNELKNYGFHISIDDFGTGYSSLNMLKNLPVDVLKIDRSFLTDTKNERANNIISHVISLALSLHMKTICEGIETEEQVNLLSDLNCDMAQGFYFARPMPIEDYEKLLYAGARITT